LCALTCIDRGLNSNFSHDYLRGEFLVIKLLGKNETIFQISFIVASSLQRRKNIWKKIVNI